MNIVLGVTAKADPRISYSYIQILPFEFYHRPKDQYINSSLIPGDQTKKLRDVMAAQLLYRCKHLCMLKLRIISHL